MGLAISVGQLVDLNEHDEESADWFRKQLQEINRVLRANRLAEHIEPEGLPRLEDRSAVGSFGYSWLHYLRRAVAYSRQSAEQFRPVASGEKPTEDPLLDHELFVNMSSHVICHSDCEGYYVPIDFPEPLYDDPKGKLAGGILGSSRPALMELVGTAGLLDIRLAGDALSDDEAERINAEEDGAHPLWIERKVWLALYEALRLSLEHRSAVVFN
jgi:hypothetical protein